MAHIILTCAFLMLISCTNHSANKVKVIKTEVIDTIIKKPNYTKDSTLTDEEKIEKIFKQFRNHKKNAIENLYCSFAYKKGAEPDVDVFDSRFESILLTVKNKFITQLINQYQSICKEGISNSNAISLYEKEKAFFVEGTYLVQFNHYSINNETTRIICLIYGNDRYAFFTLDYLVK